ncbi:hypothetical protein GLAREA_03477 [Glarea lozoyensis ATCC 20868]|uniref:Heterokaryon incompatibility domain-containing protein n=1 Tax=Glarea lozoyensis (strain ATCC 20868 / MF5171) TaxID=1116229 RepID=S3CY22_GLAL2|nr:uncharacterized protein GLAREA_03477 [Glarea lozoyensis ATCC 20868]EPE30510.1 hypothetical protein GLAREA_03477 [Glarea lozoyensis ATCC 20868]
MTTYPLLDRTQDDIRLLSFVAPDDPGMSIRATTTTIPLNAAVRSKFKALSYIPGENQVDRRTLILNGERIWVPTYLDAALRLLHNHEQKDVWVDTLCINQEDAAEKKEQANLMPRIFAEADAVMVWLGDSSKWTNSALNFMQTWGNVECNFSDAVQVQKLCDRPELWKRQSWQQVEDLFYLPYWSTRWKLQEMALARKVFILCGKKKIPFRDLEKAVEDWNVLKQPKYAHILNKRNFTISPAVAASSTLRLRSSLRLPQKKKIMTWLSNDPMAYERPKLKLSDYSLDELYALSRIREFDEFTINESITYAKPVRQMLIDFAARIINDCDDLGILELGGIGNLEPEDRYDLPSWAPTWVKGPAAPLPKLYSAAGDSKADCHWGEDEVLGEQNTLRFFASGIRCGKVLQVDTAETMLRNPAEVLGGEFAQYRVNDQHPTGIPVIQAIFRTMILDQCPGSKKRLNIEDPKFYDLAAGFLFMLQLMNQAKKEDLVEMATNYDLRVESSGKYPDFVDSFLKYRRKNPKSMTPQQIIQPFLGLPSRPQTTPAPPTWPDPINPHLGSKNLRQFILEASRCLKGRMMFSLPKGYFGVGPEGMRVGDLVCVVWGCDSPVVLRRLEDHYVLVGNCFVLGLMDGEARLAFEKGLRRGVKRERVFNLR